MVLALSGIIGYAAYPITGILSRLDRAINCQILYSPIQTKLNDFDAIGQNQNHTYCCKRKLI